MNLKKQLDEIDEEALGKVSEGYLAIKVGEWQKGKLVGGYIGITQPNYKEVERRTGRNHSDLKKWHNLYKKYPTMKLYLPVAKEETEAWVEKKRLGGKKQKQLTGEVDVREKLSAIDMTQIALAFSMELFVQKCIIEIKPQKSIVDLGCGQCRFLRRIGWLRTDGSSSQCRNCKYIGIDSRDMSEYCIGKLNQFIQGDITKCKWPSSELVIFSEVLEHLNRKDGKKVLRNIYARLKHKGYLLLTTPIMQPYIKMEKELERFGHIYYWKFDELVEYCKLLGFVVVKEYSSRFVNDKHSWKSVKKYAVKKYGKEVEKLLENFAEWNTTRVANYAFYPVVPKNEATHIKLELQK